MRETAALKPTALYLITNNINKNRYVGITCIKPPSRRWQQHIRRSREGSPTYLHRAIRKYGHENFTFRVMEIFQAYREALEAECEAIAQIKPKYNGTRGGDGAPGYRHTGEAKRRMSEQRKGRPSSRKGIPHTWEARQKMSAAQRGRPGYWKGKKMHPAIEAAKRLAHAKKWEGHVKPLKGPKRSYRKVVCLNDGNIFDKARSAAVHYGIDASSITDVCTRTRTRKTVGDLVFRFYGDHHGGKAEAEAVRASILAKRQNSAAEGRKRYIGKPIKCDTDGKTFVNINEAAEFYQVSPQGLSWNLRRASNRPRKNSSLNGLRFSYLSESA